MTDSMPPTEDQSARREPAVDLPGAPADAGEHYHGTDLQAASVTPAAQPSVPETAPASTPAQPSATEKAPVTRIAAVWVAVAVGLAVLVLLIIFILQNQDQVLVQFLGLKGSLALGVALFIAAVGGGILVALAGGARIIQLRMHDRRLRRRGKG